MNSRGTIGAARDSMDRAQSSEQRIIGDGAWRREARTPSIVADRRHAEHARHGGDGEDGLARAHEWEDPDGITGSPVRARPLPLPRYRAPGAVAGSHAADGSAPRPRRWSVRPVGGLHRDRPVAPSSRSPGRSVRTRATASPGYARIAPDQPSVAGIPVHRVGDSSALMAPPSQVERCPPNRVNSTRRMPPFGVFPVGATAIGVSFFQYR